MSGLASRIAKVVSIALIPPGVGDRVVVKKRIHWHALRGFASRKVIREPVEGLVVSEHWERVVGLGGHVPAGERPPASHVLTVQPLPQGLEIECLAGDVELIEDVDLPLDMEGARHETAGHLTEIDLELG